MGIEEMHVTFRELAQQMGMQTVRAILPENIDICLNAVIIDTVKELIAITVGSLPYNDKVARQNAAISPINGLRTLYKKDFIQEEDIKGDGTEVSPYNININSNNIMLYIGFKVSYNDSTLYDCRIIENEDLGQTLRDFCNRAAKDSPICTITGDTQQIQVDIFTGTKNMVKPKLIQYLYIKEPAKVYYDEDNTDNNVDCDLPQYLHMDIVKRAVSIYLQSIGGIRDTNKNND
mgnify:CR=1 FL=1